MADWIAKLNNSLKRTVQYEREVESSLSDLRWRGEQVLGVSGGAGNDRMVAIRERVARYSMTTGSSEYSTSEYEMKVSRSLNDVLDVLQQHPLLEQSIHTSEDKLVFGLDLTVQRQQRNEVQWMVIGLVDYAVEHSPQASAEAFAAMLERGEQQDLTCYSMMLFRGLHVECTFDVASGLSVISWQEARQYLSGRQARSLLGLSSRINTGPIAAVVAPMKWGPAIVPSDYDFAGNWPSRPRSLGDDALLVIDLMAVAHDTAVQSTGRSSHRVAREVERLVGVDGFFKTLPEGVPDDLSQVRVPVRPAAVPKKLVKVAQLFVRIRNDRARLRLALSRLASSLSRSGPGAAFDKIVDVAIALELMYQAGSELTYRLGTRASWFLGGAAGDRMHTFDTIRGFYKIRSDIMHGRARDNAGELRAIEATYRGAFDIARRTLFRIILEGCPSNSSEWDEFVITSDL